jgi:hypothetical protein
MGFAEEESDIAPVLRVQADNTPGQPVYLEYEQVSAALGKNAWIALRKSGDNVRDYVAYVYLTDASGNLKPGIGESGSLEVLGDGWVGRYADSYDTLPEGAYDVSIFLNNSYDEGIGEVVTFYVGNKIEVDKTEYRIGEDILVTATELSSSFSATISSLVKVRPLFILVPSGDQSRMSYLGSLPAQLMSLSSLAQPLAPSTNLPKLSLTS